MGCRAPPLQTSSYKASKNPLKKISNLMESVCVPHSWHAQELHKFFMAVATWIFHNLHPKIRPRSHGLRQNWSQWCRTRRKSHSSDWPVHRLPIIEPTSLIFQNGGVVVIFWQRHGHHGRMFTQEIMAEASPTVSLPCWGLDEHWSASYLANHCRGCFTIIDDVGHRGDSKFKKEYAYEKT